MPDLDRLLADAVPDPRGPGAVLGVATPGGGTRVAARGMADLDHRIALSPATVFHVASLSKQVTACLVDELVRRGTLAYDDPVDRWLPWFPVPGVRVAHLVVHTSGLRDHWALFELTGRRMEDVLTTADVVAAVRRQRGLNFAPGSSEGYSNTNYTLLAQVVAAATGRGFAEVAGAWLAELGMAGSRVVASFREVVPGRAASYEPGPDGVPRRVALSYEIAGSTSLHTTAGDLLRWSAAGRADRTPAACAAAGPPAARAGSESYGLGVRHGRHGIEPTRYHAGADAGFRSHLVRVPRLGVGVVALANLGSVDVEALCARLLDEILGPAPAAAPEPEPGTAPPSGRFLDQRHAIVLDLAVDGDAVRFDGAHGPARLAPAGAGRWRGPAGELRASPLGVAVTDDPVRRPHPWRRLESTGPALEAGLYWCAEVQSSLVVTAGAEGTTLALPGSPAYRVEHAGEGWHVALLPDRELGRVTLRVIANDTVRCSVFGAQDLLYRRLGRE